nr:unnamed protein product [Digitaria exilis]
MVARHQEAHPRLPADHRRGSWDRETTSLWHDSWSKASMLRDVLPALYSHCRDDAITVAEVVAMDGFPPEPLQPRLSSAARAELALLDDALLAVTLQPRQDGRRLRKARSPSARAGDFYTARQTPVGGAPLLADVNWACGNGNGVPAPGSSFTAAASCRLRTACPFYPGVTEDKDHLFATCPRLAPLWDRLLSGRVPLTTALGAAEAICMRPPR